MSTRRTQPETTALLPWSSGWGSQRPAGRLIASLVFGVAMSVVFVPFSIEAAQSSDALTFYLGIAAMLVGVTTAIVLAPILRVRRRRLPREIETALVHGGSTGMRVFYRQSWRRGLILWLAVGAAFLCIRGVISLSSASHSAGVRSVISGVVVVVVLLPLAMIVFLLCYLYAARNRRSYVALTPHGVSQRMGQTVKMTGWSEIGNVEACLVNSSHTVRVTPASGTKIAVDTGKIAVDTGKSVIDRWQIGLLERTIDVPVWVIGMDPALFLYTVQFYWQNPTAREELGSERALERIRSGEVV